MYIPASSPQVRFTHDWLFQGTSWLSRLRHELKTLCTNRVIKPPSVNKIEANGYGYIYAHIYV